MKRSTFLKHLKKSGCLLLREGSNHTLYINPQNGKQSTVGRHPECEEIFNFHYAGMTGIEYTSMV